MIQTGSVLPRRDAWCPMAAAPDAGWPPARGLRPLATFERTFARAALAADPGSASDWLQIDQEGRVLDVAIATCKAFPELGPYDRALLDALARRGVRAAAAVWSDPEAAWASAGAVVVQSTWDSHIDPDRFLAWAKQVERSRPLLNPVRTLEWNLHRGRRASPTWPLQCRSRSTRSASTSGFSSARVWWSVAWPGASTCCVSGPSRRAGRLGVDRGGAALLGGAAAGDRRSLHRGCDHADRQGEAE